MIVRNQPECEMATNKCLPNLCVVKTFIQTFDASINQLQQASNASGLSLTNLMKSPL